MYRKLNTDFFNPGEFIDRLETQVIRIKLCMEFA